MTTGSIVSYSLDQYQGLNCSFSNWIQSKLRIFRNIAYKEIKENSKMIDQTWIYGLISAALFYFLFFYKSRTTRLLEKFPKPEEQHVPILGVLPFFLNCTRSELLKHMCRWRELGPVIRLWSPFGSALIISDAKAAEKLLNSQTNLTKGFDYDWVRPWLGDGLLMSTGKKWTHRRKMLTPAFHFKILEDFLQIFIRESDKMVEILKKESRQSKTLDIHHFVTRCALDIICETAMGTSVNAQDVHDSDYIKAINEFGRLTQDRSFRPWLRFEPLWRLSSLYKRQQKILQILHGFTTKVISERKLEYGKVAKKSKTEEKVETDENIYFKSAKKRLAFLDLLLEVQAEKGEKELSDKDIREETDTFMFEGHDTTSANVSFTLFALGAYPDIQEKVWEELDSIFGQDKQRPATSEDLSRMKYLECVIKESLRVYPSVPFIQRSLSTDIVLDDGRTIPSGTTVGIFIYQIHKDATAFPEPEVFNPDRFATSSHDPFAFVPFSAGPRNCIGQKFAMMEEKVMLSAILRNFRIKAMIPPKELQLLSEMILRSENGLPVQLTVR